MSYPVILRMFLKDELPHMDIEATSLQEVLDEITEAYQAYEDQVIDSLNDDPSHGLDNSSLKYEVGC